MFAGLARIIAGLAVFIAVGTLIHIPIEASATLGFLAGTAYAVVGWYSAKTRIYTAKELQLPFNKKLSLELGKATETAVALAGDETYSVKIAGSQDFNEQFKDLLDYAGLQDGDLLEVQSALVCEPANSNPYSVAVTCGGVVLGYINQFESESLYKFLMQHRGMARVNSNIRFDVVANASLVELDLARPYRLVSGV